MVTRSSVRRHATERFASLPPVLRDGKTIAAISLSVPTAGVARTGDAGLDSLGRLAVDAAARITRLLPLD